MVQTCSAFGCKKRATPENVANGLHFHRFPTDEVIGKQWILATRKVDFQPSKHSRLCSDHFGIEDYYVQNDGAFRLNKDAVPSVFEGLPKHLQKSLKPKRKPPMERSNIIPAKIAKMASSTSNIAAALQKVQENCLDPKKENTPDDVFDTDIYKIQRLRVLTNLDHNYTLPDNIKQKYFTFKDRALEKIEEQKNEIRRLKTIVRTQRQKIDKFSELLLELRKEKMIDSKTLKLSGKFISMIY